ncbi:MAG: SDR family NAD(P)-dependent oxidoreductase [Actinomycetota bacterium]
MAEILVTGAGSGFGKGTVIELAERGHTVTAATFLASEAEALAAEHPGLSTIVLDVTDQASVAQVEDRTVDVLVNNAGRGLMAPLTSVPIDEVRKTFDVNVFGMLAMCQAVIPGMKARGSGRIINVSSIAGILSGAMSAPYAMTKHAVEALSVAMREELAPYGIDVTKINPGPYLTGFNDRMVDGIEPYLEAGDEPAHAAHQFLKTVMENQADPNEIVQAIADLAEADSTPVETFLPEGIREMLQQVLDSRA